MEDEVKGVSVYCAHEFKRPYKPPPKHVEQLLTVRFYTKSYQRIRYDNNGSPLVSTHLHPCGSPSNVYTRARNPYCDKCMIEIVLFLIQHGYCLDGAVDEFYRFFFVVQCKIHTMLQSYHNNDGHGTVKFNEVIWYEVPVNAPDRVCSEEDYRSLLANGEVFEPLVVRGSSMANKLAVIKGLEIVDDVQDLLVKEDNLCAICLDKFSAKDEETTEDDPNINDQEGVTTYDDDDNGGSNGTTKNNKLIVRLPCKHVFHQGCIGKWVQRNHVCPYCRFRLPVEYNDHQ